MIRQTENRVREPAGRVPVLSATWGAHRREPLIRATPPEGRRFHSNPAGPQPNGDPPGLILWGEDVTG